MNKSVLFLFLFATTTQLFASELTTVDEPEVTDTQRSAGLKIVGVASSFKSSKRLFLRDGVKVAALITSTESIGNEPPKIGKVIQFFIDDENWVEINLGDPRLFRSHFVAEVTISATNDSITVTASKKGYLEVFFKSTATFLDGANREKIAPSFLSLTQSPQ